MKNSAHQFRISKLADDRIWQLMPRNPQQAELGERIIEKHFGQRMREWEREISHVPRGEDLLRYATRLVPVAGWDPPMCMIVSVWWRWRAISHEVEIVPMFYGCEAENVELPGNTARNSGRKKPISFRR